MRRAWAARCWRPPDGGLAGAPGECGDPEVVAAILSPRAGVISPDTQNKETT